MIRGQIEKAVKAVLADLGILEVAFVVERPAQMEHGDYATNAALAAGKLLKKNPKEVAEELRGKLLSQKSIPFVERIEVAGAGFINFFLSREALLEVARHAGADVWGRSSYYTRKHVLIEYTSPNLFKPLHIGNLVGNILGESVSRLIEYGGAEVARLNYPSDIGLTVAKGVWGLWKNNLDASDIAQLGKAYVAGNAAYEEDEAAKKEIEEINRALYDGSSAQWSALRERGIETSRAHLDDLCERLGTRFDAEFFESQSGPLGRDIVKQHPGVFEESDGAVIYRGKGDGLHTRVFLNSQGLPTYEAKEVGLFELKSGAYPDFDISITVTGKEQAEFFKVVFAALRRLFPERTQGRELRQISNGFLRLTTGKMSSRKGNVITGESLLADLQEKARKKMGGREVADPEQIAQQVAVGAIKYAVLKQGSGKDIIFDPEKSLSLEGDSGPYLQYAHTRALSLLRQAQKAGIEPDISDAPEQAGILPRLIVHFPDVVERATAELEPHYVTTYLTEFAGTFNSWYASERVIGGEHPRWGVLLVQDVESVLRKGLDLLGIPAPEEM